LYVWRAVDSEGEVRPSSFNHARPQGGAQADAKTPEEAGHLKMQGITGNVPAV
jgi:hypothetical protein